MNNEVTTIDTNNYAVMAKAMGMSGEISSSDKKSKTLPRFRINHSPIIGSDKVLVKGGTYKLEIPDEFYTLCYICKHQTFHTKIYV